MVYESDFYTTRRPYTSSRPTITSYSVTGQTFHRNIPHIAHKQLVIVGPSAHAMRLKQSAYLAEIDRIYHKVRPSLAYQPTEDYLNSRSIVSFDDETRSIRAKTAEILKKIHTPIPRAQRPMPLPGDAYYSHSELPISERISSDNYIDRLLSANREVQHNVLTMSHYDEPAKHYNSIGKGHLACVSFAGGRPISRRRNLASADDYIRDDINVLSHYGRFRAAANGVPHVPDTAFSTYQIPFGWQRKIPTMFVKNIHYYRNSNRFFRSEMRRLEYAADYSAVDHRPPTKSTVTGSWKSNAPHKTERPESAPESAEKEHHIKANLVAGEEFDSALDRKKKRREAVEAAAIREAEEEKRRKHELLRQEELAIQAALERQEELERRARQDEEAQRLKEEEEIIARENAERLAAEKKAQAEAEKKAQEEAERKEKEEAERLAKEEEERKAKEEAERLAKEEEERKAKEEADRLAKEEEERKAKEEAERLAKEEEERKAKEEAERLAKEEEERKAKEEAERLAKEEEERKAKEEAERLAKEEEERKAKEEEEARLAAENAEPEKTEDESGPEPVVEEPQSPEDQPAANTEAAEEVEDEEEEEEE